MIPGMNILSTALRVIARQSFQYYAYNSRTKNAAGLLVPSYDSPKMASGSVQPVPRTIYEQNGLDLQKNYMTFFVEKDIIDIGRDVAGDKFVYNNQTFQALSITNWYSMDGWVPVLTVQVDNNG